MKILVLADPSRKIEFDSVVDALPKGHHHSIYDPKRPLNEQIADAEIIVDTGILRITREFVDTAKNLRFIQRYGVGLDHIDVSYLLGRKIMLSNTPGVFSGKALAEHAILLMLGLSKNINDWREVIGRKGKGEPIGNELTGKTLGIIGLGASGSQLARLAKAFRMRVLGIDVVALAPSRIKELGLDFFDTLESLTYLLKESDFISIHVPLTEKTRKMIATSEFEQMKATARLINVARGDIIDEQSLMVALKSGKIAGAGMDVYPNEPIDPANPILSMHNVIVSPHLAGDTWETLQGRVGAVRENVLRVIEGKLPLYMITAPP